MAAIITIHSARRGTGKSTLVASIGALLAAQGKRVGILDTNLQSSSQHLFFGVPQEVFQNTFTNYLLGECDGAQTTYDVTAYRNIVTTGRVFLIPATGSQKTLKQVLGEGYLIELITDGLISLADQFALDVLLIDTPALMSDETLLSILSLAITDISVIILQLDQQNYQGTGVMLDVVRMLEVPRIKLVVNQVSTTFEPDAVIQQVEEAYQCDVASVLPYSDEIATLGSSGIFALRYPNHQCTHLLMQLAITLIYAIEKPA